MAIHLIDAQNEATGATVTSDTQEYRVRAAALVTTLLNEAYPYCDTYLAKDYDAGAAYDAGECANYGGYRYLRLADADGSAEGTPDTDAARWLRVCKADKRATHPPGCELEDTVYMDDLLCLSVLPAGLAALLIYGEDATQYNAYWGDYQQRLSMARASLPTGDGFESITSPYGGIEYGEFSRWN
jgi:hypothetical protein